jgi:phosphate butyryltransferase
MTYGSFDEMVRMVKAKGDKKRFAVVAADSRRTLEAVLAAYSDGLVEPILIGETRTIHGYVEEIVGKAGKIAVIPASSPEESAQKAVDLISAGKADCIMKGRIETWTLMSVLLRRENNLRTGGTVSGMGILQIPSYHKLLALTDGGVNLFPDLMTKRLIIENAVRALRELGIERPKVGVAAAVEVVNPKIPATVDARALRAMNERGEIKDCIIEGPISYDLAISKEAAQAKGFESPVAGDADLLVWPDINSGNLVWKALVHSAGARAAGSVLGLRVPVVGSSRASTFDEKYLSVALAVARAS